MGLTSFTSTVATPGTIQRITAGATPALPVLSGALAGTITPRCSRIVITSDPGNTAAKNLFVGGAALNVAANTGWFGKIAPGASLVIGSEGGPAHDLADFFIDTDGTTAKYGVEGLG